MEASLLQTFGAYPQARTVPVEGLEPGAVFVAKHKKVATQWIIVQQTGGQGEQALEPPGASQWHPPADELWWLDPGSAWGTSLPVLEKFKQGEYFIANKAGGKVQTPRACLNQISSTTHRRDRHLWSQLHRQPLGPGRLCLIWLVLDLLPPRSEAGDAHGALPTEGCERQATGLKLLNQPPPLLGCISSHGPEIAPLFQIRQTAILSCLPATDGRDAPQLWWLLESSGIVFIQTHRRSLADPLMLQTQLMAP